VLIGNRGKLVALRELFGAKRNQRFITKRILGKIYLYIDTSSIFNERPLLIADSDILIKNLRAKIPSTKCYETIRCIVRRSSGYSRLNAISNSIYS
jgi:hypothetical protein